MVLEQARRNHNNLEIGEIHSFAKEIELNNGTTFSVDWDYWSGEDWLTLLKDRRRVGIVCIKLPLAFIATSIKNDIASHSIFNKLHVETIDDFDIACWNLSINDFNSKFSELDWHGFENALNPEAFSTNELWYATV